METILRSLIVAQIVLFATVLFRREDGPSPVMMRICLFACILACLCAPFRLVPPIGGIAFAILFKRLIPRNADCRMGNPNSMAIIRIISSGILMGFIIIMLFICYQAFKGTTERIVAGNKGMLPSAISAVDRQGSFVMSPAEIEQRVEYACDAFEGVGAYRRATIKRTENDTAFIFNLTVPEGTNCSIIIKKRDGSVICSPCGTSAAATGGNRD